MSANMDPPRRGNSGIQTQRHARLAEPSLSTAPASPIENADDSSISNAPQNSATSTFAPPSLAPPYSTLGHLSFAPATQQTVVTTTTTTTVSLPPLLFRPPTDLSARDPKQYPLAFSPTPASLKHFRVDAGGQPILYREADDAQASLTRASHAFPPLQSSSRAYHKQQAKLGKFDGILRHERNNPTTALEPALPISRNNNTRSSLEKRPASPPSLAEAAEIASLQRRRKRPRSLLHRTRSGLSQPTFTEHNEDAAHAGPLPVTPDTEAGTSQATCNDQSGRASERVSSRVFRERQRAGSSRRQTTADSEFPGFFSEQRGPTATPPVTETDLDPLASFPREHEYARPLPPTLLTSSQQDASLPSPSLSPVTAAANLARSHQQLLNAASDAHDVNDDGNVSEVSGLDLDEAATKSTRSRVIQPFQPSLSQSDEPAHRIGRGQAAAAPFTVMHIPDMIESFDALPDDMKAYVLYQMLKRCQKKTLQTVAAVVNPALKCDPFDVLPVELGLQITKHLDAKTLCRAAQVSKRWRQLIDSDERVWKELLEQDGFNLPVGEVERAVREGWGWQNPGIDGYEQDLGLPRPLPMSLADQDALSPVACPSASSDDSTTQRITRLKRKSTSHGSSSKRQKRKASVRKIDDLPPVWLKDLEEAQGPIAYASAAAKAVPNPNIGLPSLSNLHLFKSIYQRHHLISKSWMDQDSLPQHLAFRAHHRHVVTCLLFDSDKILTGSDDTNINIYDTKTGVLRKRLEGHEGGVWALQYEGDTLVSGSTDRSVRVWDIPSGKCLQTFQGHTSTVRCLVILKPAKIGVEADGTPIMMPKEPLIITGSRDSTLRVWKLPQPGDAQIHQAGPPANDSDNPHSLRVLQGHHNSVRAIAAHGDTLVSGSYDCTVRVWKISTGELVHRLSGHSQKVYSVVLDHERGRCISGSMDNLVKVWSIESGACLFNLEGHTSLVGLLDLSHERLVSAAADSTLRIWHPETGQCLSTLSAHTGAITCFQHDEQKVISGSDRTLKMWNMETGECVRDLLSDLSGVWQVRFDERRCVAAVQRNGLTYIEVLDFGAVRDGVPEMDRGRRIVVDLKGREVEDPEGIAEVRGEGLGEQGDADRTRQRIA